MKRCKSDELPLDEEQGLKPAADAALRQQGDAAPTEAACPSLSLPPSSRNNKTPDLKRIQQLSEGGSGGMFGHGLKQLFHHRKRSRERDQSMQDSSQLHHHSHGHSDHDSADEKERSPEMHRVSYAMSLHDLPARPTAFNRVLQQIRSRPSIKRGASLHSSSRRSKSGPAETQKGSPHLMRKVPQDSSLTAILQQHQYRPRSSSTTDTSLSAGEISTIHQTGDESERITDKLEKGDVSTLGLPANTSHGGSDSNISLDVPDGTPDPHKTKAAIDHLHQKILKITEQIKIEQTARDDNVAEYLKLANNADKQQASRIKQVFEKKNQKSAQTIAQLHKKLEHYHRKLKEIEQNGLSRQPKDVLRDMQQGLKDVGANVRAGISGFGGGVVEGVKGGLSGLSQVTHTAVVSKPREFASLIRNKFGSADNIAHLKDTLDESHQEETARTLSGSATLVSSPKYGSEDECSSATSGSAGGSNSGAGAGGMGSPKSNTLDSHHNNFDTILDELREIKDSQSHLEDAMEDLKGQLQRDYAYMTQCLQEERYRYERLEEQLNDLTELHQNEMSNLKQELASMEEKVAYQSDERARDIQEALESCLTRITKLELQQQQQQVVQLEGVENANARALLGKFINVILALMAVILVFVSTIANFITPLMKTRFRVLSTLLLVLFLVSLWKQWENIMYFSEQIQLPS
ncbi:transmembrane and coiled-coil domains protein 2 isoform X1 [Scyliorhinus canicula]|uniref:transmembrane and coiled-coil domains protein 2 isoform X1 n=1 Tax=Scyliorhinus canicula TaxID=7830 RepID=UPI0018F5B96F|nr:transmembrane and coiled-coil domains protein 2 isoform X1 [Scyliorhinus canicula]XP_038676731.1 transmembrane and coiled-coil domains protein 2 isoform X1 [Scyliorhinus canicula]